MIAVNCGNPYCNHAHDDHVVPVAWGFTHPEQT